MHGDRVARSLGGRYLHQFDVTLRAQPLRCGNRRARSTAPGWHGRFRFEEGPLPHDFRLPPARHRRRLVHDRVRCRSRRDGRRRVDRRHGGTSGGTVSGHVGRARGPGQTDRVQTLMRVRSTAGGASPHLHHLRDDQRLDPVALQWQLVSHVVLDVPPRVTDWPTWSTGAVRPCDRRVDVRDPESTDLPCTMRFVPPPTRARAPDHSGRRVRRHARRS